MFQTFYMVKMPRPLARKLMTVFLLRLNILTLIIYRGTQNKTFSNQMFCLIYSIDLTLTNRATALVKTA